MNEDHERYIDEKLIIDKTFWEIYPVDLSLVEDVSVLTLSFSVRTSNILMRNGITTLHKLYSLKASEFASFRNAGKKCIDEVHLFFYNYSRDASLGSIAEGQDNSHTIHCFKTIKENVENILNGDFSFVDGEDISEQIKEEVEKYREALDILGADLARKAFESPNSIVPVMNMFVGFIRYTNRFSRKRKEINERLMTIPSQRLEKKVKGYIKAYTRNEDIQLQLESLYQVTENPNARIKDINIDYLLEQEDVYARLLNFLEWCSFDIKAEAQQIFRSIFERSPRNEMILKERAQGSTLDAVGNKIGITRERIRQIEAKAKRIFAYHQNQKRILSKISAELNGDTVLSSAELMPYFEDKYFEMVYLLRTSGSASFYYDSQLDLFVMGDESIDGMVSNIISKLPDAFDEKTYAEVIEDAVENQGIPQELIEKAICDEFPKDGYTYHRARMSLSAIYMEILTKYYPQGIDVYDDSELSVVRYIATEEYGCNSLPENNRAISARISDLTILCGRGRYMPKKSQYISKELASKIHKFIEDSPSEIFLTNTLFALFEDDLLEFGVDNKYYLQGILRELFGNEYVFRRDYISKSEFASSFYVEIVSFVKKYDYPISKKVIYEAFPGVTEVMIAYALSDANVLNMFGKYIHASKLNISTYDKNYLNTVLSKFLAYEKPKHYIEIFEYVQKDDPNLLNKLFIDVPSAMYSVLEYLFKDKYQFKRPYISNLNVEIYDPEAEIREMILGSDEIDISDVTEYARDNHYEISSILELMDSFNKTHGLVSQQYLGSWNFIGVDEDIANQVIELLEMNITETTLISSLECLYKLPKISVPWTDWLVYSVARKWGENLEVGTTYNQFRLSAPLIAPKGQLDSRKFEGVNSPTEQKIFTVDNLDNIDDLIADEIELDFEEDWI